MNFEEIIQNLKAGQLDFDCKKMSLVQPKGDGISFDGKGYIRLSDNKILSFKIYVTRFKNTDQFQYLRTVFGAAPGKLYSEKDFYELVAVAHDGMEWTAKNILPTCNWSVEGEVVVEGTIASILTQRQTNATGGYLKVHFFDELEVPLTLLTKTESHGSEYYQRDRAKFSALGCEFEVRNRSGELSIETSSSEQLPAFLYLRLQEALHYLVAKPVAWRARVERKDKLVHLEIASATPMSAGTKLAPPISRASPGFFEDGWRLFALYLEYVVRLSTETYWTPCTYHIHNACEASANSIDAWAVGVCVAVEGIANLLPNSFDAEQKARLAALQQSLRRFLSDHKEFSEFSSRMNGLISMLSAERVKDKLLRLGLTGHVDPEYVKSWGKLRNRQVHPKLTNLKKIAIEEVEELLNLIRQCEVLMWQITFYLIGYSGKFSDLGAAGLRSKDYPLNA
ncbi:MAG: hypothetical protein ABSC72_00680 [Methylovirgula sp.]